MWSNPQNPAQWAIWAYAVVSDFKSTGVKMFLLKLLWEFPKFNRCENINKIQTEFPRSGMHIPYPRDLRSFSYGGV